MIQTLCADVVVSNRFVPEPWVVFFLFREYLLVALKGRLDKSLGGKSLVSCIKAVDIGGEGGIDVP